MRMRPLLEVEQLHLTIPVQGTQRTVVDECSFSVCPGESVGLIGESGSGKSMTARSLLRLLPEGAELSGGLRFNDRDVLDMSANELQSYRNNDVAMVFQDPRAHINPVRRIGDFLTESLRLTRGVKSAVAERRAVDLLAEVGIEDGERRLRQYPHQLSGGLLQRVMIASALISEPALLIADEPTTALDVTTQSEVVAILDRLRRERDLALVFITHDIDLASAICGRICVMYAGAILENQSAETLQSQPLHPYTSALMRSRPLVTESVRRLPVVPGQPISAFEAPEGCVFSGRCPHANETCRTEPQRLEVFDTDRLVRCYRADQLLEVHEGGTTHG